MTAGPTPIYFGAQSSRLFGWFHRPEKQARQTAVVICNPLGDDYVRAHRSLRHLAHLRASQINRCGFCVKMHTREAREDGEANERLDRVVVWDQVSDFTEPERAALAWTEALTILDARTDFRALRARMREHFSEKEIAALSSTIAMVNLWNRINHARN